MHGVVVDRVLVLAPRAGSAVAFLVASPVVARNGYLIEQVARAPRAPNGSSELLIDAAIRRFADDDRVYVTLGPVALSSPPPSRMRLTLVVASDDNLRAPLAFVISAASNSFARKYHPPIGKWCTRAPTRAVFRFARCTRSAQHSPAFRRGAFGLGVLRAVSHEIDRVHGRLASANRCELSFQ